MDLSRRRGWAGVGVAHAASGTYTFYVWFSPTPSGSRILPSASVKGYGYLCTPHGERYGLRVLGGTAGQVWADMDGHRFGLRAYCRPIVWQFTGQVEQPPRLSFTGRWSGPDLVMTEEEAVTFTETTWWFFGPDVLRAGDEGQIATRRRSS